MSIRHHSRCQELAPETSGGKMWSFSQLCRLVPARPFRRSLYVLFLWTCMCYVAFRYTGQENTVPYMDSNINTRLLLQKIIETRVPRTDIAFDNRTAELNFFDANPLLDRSPALSEKELVHIVQKKIPNLPILYWMENKKKAISKNKTCAKYPSIYDLHFNNIYWQELVSSNGTFYFFGAYMDNRKKNRLGPAVRILGMINRIEPTVKTFCQFWFNASKEPVFSKVLEYKYIWYKKWGNYKQGIFQPYLLACQIPKGHHGKIPLSVSVVEKMCDTGTNNLRVIYDKPATKEEFAVCVKGLDFLHEDMSVRLVEWLELLHILGASKVFMYELEVHPNITKVLRYYQRIGRVEVTPLTLPGPQPNIPGLLHMYLKSKVNNKRQNELIPYNDCLYKNMYRYKYIALLDTDEVIMPKQHLTWKELMEEVMKKALHIKNETRASYNVRNVYFLDDLSHEHGWFKEMPRYMHMLQHVYRSKNYTKPGQYVKCFHNPARVLTLHNHFPLACLGGMCTSYPINTTDAHLQHYRSDCVNTLKKSCASEYRKHSKMDTTVWKYKDELIRRTTDTLAKLGFFGSGSRATGPLLEKGAAGLRGV